MRDQRYTVQALENLGFDSISDMRKEYTRLRDIAQKRIKRLQQSEFAQSKPATTHPQGFRKLAEIDPRDFAKAFSELHKFVEGATTSVSGQRQRMNKTIRSWQDKGLDLNKGNYSTVMDILDAMRKQKIVYGSDKVVELADATLARDDMNIDDIISSGSLDKFLEHSDELMDIRDMPEGLYWEAQEIIDELGW